MHAPRIKHIDAVHHILRYLKISPVLGLFFTTDPQSGLTYFTDADYAGSKMDRRSTLGLCTFYSDHLISWKKAEYRAMAQGTCEILWLCSILVELGFEETAHASLFCDNKSAIMLSSNFVIHKRTKHIEMPSDEAIETAKQLALQEGLLVSDAF
ncbi:hypothetical protein CsSME_00020002 [Camellia sinensis var. sinensis]